MPTLSSKRQVTIPKDLCNRLDVHAGDDLMFLEHNGRITIIKKTQGSSAGVVSHLKPDPSVSDSESLEDEIEMSQGQREDLS